ncbi:fimbrial protein [Enterobacter cloacae]|uniref:fimbrial protein n=1 Tax=Enterobacter cloacae TaxID=550 RepID=UPI00254B3366|nr:fimbrial protein [Enterobacter cloacae]
MNMWRWMIILVGLTVSQASWALCSASGSFSISPGSIVVQRDAVVGQPISDWLMSNQGVAYQNCNYDSTTQYLIVAGIKNTGSKASVTWNGEAVFNTNVAGVGFVFEGRTSFDSNPLPDNWTGIASGQSQVFTTQTSHSSGYHPSINDQARIRLIKTGNITPGTLSGNLGRFIAGTRENAQWSTEIPIAFSGGQITTVACTVNTPDVDVNLDQHKKSEFTGAGSATEWKAFNIELDCDKSSRINVRIDATQDPSNIAGVMKLDSAAGDLAATGIGVQLYFAPDNSAVQFGQTKFYYTSPNGGFETVQLKARYYQTTSAITAGEANVTATFTLTYQ